eukprot:1935432-Prymnesium_polylepis.1
MCIRDRQETVHGAPGTGEFGPDVGHSHPIVSRSVSGTEQRHDRIKSNEGRPEPGSGGVRSERRRSGSTSGAPRTASGSSGVAAVVAQAFTRAVLHVKHRARMGGSESALAWLLGSTSPSCSLSSDTLGSYGEDVGGAEGCAG